MNHCHWIFNVQTFWFAYCAEKRIIHVRVLTIDLFNCYIKIYVSVLIRLSNSNYVFIVLEAQEYIYLYEIILLRDIKPIVIIKNSNFLPPML